MKTNRSRLSRRELLLIFIPYPLLWLSLGLVVDPAVFRFWVVGQSIPTLSAMTLWFVPLCFSALYLPTVLMVHASGKVITGSTVAITAFIAASIGLIMTPLP